ncbi:MAG: filamentous hemagglutinin family protein [Nitrospiraceae bacterium]|nr:filamentous hemagglutinin family protein [Nitrospiraceae bacterium]
MKGQGLLKTGFFKKIISLLCCAIVLAPDFALARPVYIPGFKGQVILPSQSQLPQLRPGGIVQGLNQSLGNNGLAYSPNQLTIYQNQPNAIIDWQQFNIGEDASVQFYQGTGTPGTPTGPNKWQPNNSYAALNRIWDSNPSYIFGHLNANGKIFLINQNGIVFGPNSQVNTGSLVASALNLRNSDFMTGTMQFYLEDGTGSDVDLSGNPYSYNLFTYPEDSNKNPSATVSNYGTINASQGGHVFLIGPQVQNYGTINAELGQAGLIAGTQVWLTPDSNGGTALVVDIESGAGQAWNYESGQLLSDMGMAGMYGSIVNQEGLVRSITSVNQNGQIELRASGNASAIGNPQEIEGQIITGKNSETECPIAVSADTADNSLTPDQAKITLGGLQTITKDGDNTDAGNGADPGLIALHGAIDAPFGQVQLKAGSRVFMDSGSRINVGGNWIDEPASATLIEAQLNSDHLSDAYLQKNGVLQGQHITTSTVTGSSIGDISSDMTSLQYTAQEKAINGGTITITSGGDILAGNGSELDFSGGGITYSGGALQTTELLSGHTMYGIGDAPQNIQYSKILGQYQKTWSRFGLSKTYTGIYYGSGAPLKTGLTSFKKGGDAGTLNLTAGKIVLDGQLIGKVTQGIFQTLDRRTLSLSDENLLLDEGVLMPTAGNLVLDVRTNAGSSIEIQQNSDYKSPIGDITTFDPDDLKTNPVLTGPIFIAAGTLSSSSSASLGSVTLLANKSFTTDAGTKIILSPGGSFTATASRIEQNGTVLAPAGSVTLSTPVKDYVNPDDPLIEGVFLGQGSSMNVSGQRVDNSMAATPGGSPISTGLTQGGTITIEDESGSGKGVFVPDGATLDVSGGYEIDEKGKVNAGNAGTLHIEGPAVSLNGNIKGYALADSGGKVSGGKIILHSDYIDVTDNPSNVPADSLVLAGNFFANTGFTNIELDSFNDLTIGTSIAPSLVKLKTPRPGTVSRANVPVNADRDGLITLDTGMAYETGPASFSANAGQLFSWQKTTDNNTPDQNGHYIIQNTSAGMNVTQGSVISTAPGGTITLTAQGNITMEGVLNAMAGKIDVETKGNLLDISGSILAAGYNRPDISSTVAGHGLNYIPMNGGQVILQSNGKLDLESSSVIDISGSDAVKDTMIADGKVVTWNETSNPGSLSLSYLTNLDLSGGINVAKTAGLPGGTLVISKTDSNATNAGMNVTSETCGTGASCPFGISDNGITSINLQGLATMWDSTQGPHGAFVCRFDDITLQSQNSIDFKDPNNGPITATLDRKLTLDAPQITGSGQDTTLQAPWIVLTNTWDPTTAGSPAAATGGNLTLSSTGWIDVTGSVGIGGFKEVDLDAARDIRLSRQDYSQPSTEWGGGLWTAGDLVMKADNIYPTTLSAFTIQSGGKVTVLPADHPVGGPIMSAGGDLAISAVNGIEIRGNLEAPMGSITLNSGGRVYLADGSVVTTAVSPDTMVNYGSIATDSNNIWTIDQTAPGSTDTVKGAPVSSVTINGQEVIIRSGATVDASGGGQLYAYGFQPDVEGTINPIGTKSGSDYTIVRPDGNYAYVIMPDNSIQEPGDAVYISGGAGLKAGVYSLLPAEDAFLPGAVIIEQQNLKISDGEKTLMTGDGFPVVAGYSTVSGTNIRSINPTAYSVMPASFVLSEGNMGKQTMTAGDGGNVSISGNTVVIDGKINAAPLDNTYNGGKLSLVAANIDVMHVQEGSWKPLLGPPDMFSITVPQALQDTLTIADSSLDNKGFREIDLGDSDPNDNIQTDSINIEKDAYVEAPIISLAANTVSINAGATLYAKASQKATKDSGEGVINIGTLTNPVNVLNAGPAANLHSTYAVGLNVNNPNGIPKVLVDDSAIILKSSAIYFGPDGGTAPGSGLYLTPSEWGTLSGFDDITLQSATDIEFTDNTTNDLQSGVTLTANNSLTLDAAQILSGGYDVTLSAPTVNLKNSGATPAYTAASGGTFAVNAGSQINVGGGDVLFGGFKNIALNSHGDLTLNGQGSLATGGADLNINAARVVAVGARKANSGGTMTYMAPNFHVVAGLNKSDMNPAGVITMSFSGGQTGTASGADGGTLEFQGRNIEMGTTVQSDGGTIKLAATGSGPTDGIQIESGALIRAEGTADAPGGQIILSAANGSVNSDSGSTIDVQAGAQGDAGFINIYALMGGNNHMTLQGQAGQLPDGASGMGGSFTLDTSQIQAADLDKIIDGLGNGGFTGNIDIRTHAGNITVDAGHTLTAQSIKLTADDDNAGNINPTDEDYWSEHLNDLKNNGNTNINGTLEALGGKTGGGDVELYSYHDLNIRNGGSVSGQLSSDGTTGGKVLLNSEQGTIRIINNGTVDAPVGTVYMRAQQNGPDVHITLAPGSIKRTANIYVEAFEPYLYTGSITTSQYATSKWLPDASNFYSNNEVAGRMQSLMPNGSSLQLLPGIEVDSSGDITLAALDLTHKRYGGEPGVLTLRAGGNLNINGNLTDTTAVSGASPARSSWGFNLVAGADTSSADYMAASGAGNLTIANQAVVYTASAPIHFASGGDTVINAQANEKYMNGITMGYNLASYGGPIQGWVGGDLELNGGVIQTAVGDIDIDVTGNVDLSSDLTGSLPGAIRTTGWTSYATTSGAQGIPYAATYTAGGNIVLNVGGEISSVSGISSALWENAWDSVYTTVTAPYWSASYGVLGSSGRGIAKVVPALGGLAAMGGGNLLVRAGGDFQAQAGTFGQNDPGDLEIFSGGNIQGRFLNTGGNENTRVGNVEIVAGGNFGGPNNEQVIEAANSRINVHAGGDMVAGAVVNPVLLRLASNAKWLLTYTENTSLRMTSGGDITLAGDDPFKPTLLSDNQMRVLPAQVDIEAGGNILIGNSFALTPSPIGNLTLKAGGNITGAGAGASRSFIYVSDTDPGSVYTSPNASATSPGNLNSYLTDLLFSNLHDSKTLLHDGDTSPVIVRAGGDITNLALFLPKAAQVTAGGNINDLYYIGQNISADDVSEINAEGNIELVTAAAASSYSGLEQDGPGLLVVRAGGSIDLGQSAGIHTKGNANNSLLEDQGSGLVVVSGYADLDMTGNLSAAQSNAGNFFDTLRNDGSAYTLDMSKGDNPDANAALQNANSIIKNALGSTTTSSGTGNIEMTSSQISTEAGPSDIFILAKGAVDVGTGTLISSEQNTSNDNTKTGIFTAGGGAINIYANGDINVNESRVMTFFGGDITVWSENGNVNAGKGPKAVVSASPPAKVKVYDAAGNWIGYTKKFTPPAVGSGIRAVTFNPGPGQVEPAAGNIYAFAPTGTIDAGEAGIAGKNVTLGATHVVNGQNVTFSGVGVGVPVQSVAVTDLGAMSGAGSVTSGTTQMAQAASAFNTSNTPKAADVLSNMMLNWVDVTVIDIESSSTMFGPRNNGSGNGAGGSQSNSGPGSQGSF